MTKNGKRVTMADVARAAGVSKMTVSRVINDKGEIAEDTRKKVRLVMAELGYTPHAQAQRLGTGRSNTISLLYPAHNLGRRPINLMELDFMVGAATAAGEEGYFFNLVTTPVTKDTMHQMFRSAQVDGLIIMQVHMDDWRVNLLRENDYPFTMVGRTADNTGLDFVDFHFEEAVVVAYDYLVQLGHEKISFINYPETMHQNGYGPGVRALHGYQTALNKHNLTGYICDVDFNTDDIYKATLKLVKEQPYLTAIVSPHDVGAFGILRAIQYAGLRIPEDISYIGMMTNKVAELVTPQVTAIRFPTYDMAYEATKKLVDRLQGDESPPLHSLVKSEIIVRESTGPARNTGPATR
ncbi:LacI family DNA-binding transcriptional regulator [Chloroflexota bacterium]